MSNQDLKGSAVALVTPFREDFSIDTDALKQLVHFHAEAGTDIIIPCGTTGESPTLNPEEQADIIRIVRDEAKGKMLVAAGAGTNSTRSAVTLAKNAEDAGAEAILSVAPYYSKPSQEGIYQHYRHIAEAVSVPIIIYNVPGRTGCNVSAETILRLAGDFSNIAAVKEASEALSENLFHDLPGLNIGEAIILGRLTKIPVMVKIGERETAEGGFDIDLDEEFQKALNHVDSIIENDIEILPDFGSEI